MKWILKEMQPGDMVRVPSGSFYHYAICTGEDSIIQFGDSIVNPNVDPETVEVNEVGIDEFLKGRFAQVAEFDKKELKRKNSPAKIVLNAKMSIGKKGYHILYNNCEHFVNECVFNDHKCSQTESFRENFGKTFPMIDIYVSDVSRYKNNNQLPKYAKLEIKKCKNESVIEQKKSVYGLLDYAVTSSFNKPLECKKLFKNKSGKPCHKNYFVSFSHTDELICVAVSKQNIGVDIEEIKEHKALDPLKSHILSSEEAASNFEELLELWTKKEAIFKFDDSIEKYVPSSIDSGKYNTKTVKIVFEDKSYYLSVAAENVANVNILTLDGEAIK